MVSAMSIHLCRMSADVGVTVTSPLGRQQGSHNYIIHLYRMSAQTVILFFQDGHGSGSRETRREGESESYMEKSCGGLQSGISAKRSRVVRLYKLTHH